MDTEMKWKKCHISIFISERIVKNYVWISKEKNIKCVYYKKFNNSVTKKLKNVIFPGFLYWVDYIFVGTFPGI